MFRALDIGRDLPSDDVDALRVESQNIDGANCVWRSWCENNGGSVVELSGPEGVLEIAPEFLDTLPKIKAQYAEAINAEVAVGVGIKLSEAQKALKLARNRGGKICLYGPQVDEELKAEEDRKHPTGGIDKLAADFLNKAAPPLNQGDGAGIQGPSQPSVPSVMPPMGEGSGHSEGEVAQGVADGAPSAPEGTHAESDLEERMHEMAAQQEEQDQQTPEAPSSGNEIKAKVVAVLKQVQVAAPQLEQMAQSNPEIYEAIVNMTNAVIAMAREIPGDTSGGPGIHSVAEIDAAAGLTKAEVEELFKAGEFRAAAFYNPKTRQVVETGPFHDEDQLEDQNAMGNWVDGFVDHEGKFYNRQEATARLKLKIPPEHVKSGLGGVESSRYFAGRKDPTLAAHIKATHEQGLDLQNPRVQRRLTVNWQKYNAQYGPGMKKSETTATSWDAEHVLPSHLAAEGYKLSLMDGDSGVVGTVHRGGQVVGRVQLAGGKFSENWNGGSVPRAGLDIATRMILDGHVKSAPIQDGWNEAATAPPPRECPLAPFAKAIENFGGPDTPVAGSSVTAPHNTYEQASVAKPKDALAESNKNLWVRQSNHPDNSSRTLMMQFSSDLLQGNRQRDHADDYYDKLYGNREGYHRPADFWEIPQWQAHMAHSMPNADHYTVRDPQEAIRFANAAGYKNIAFSALDVNKEHVRDFAKNYKGHVVVGGYTDMNHFADLPNVAIHPTVQSFVESEGQQYKPGYDYRHFSGTKTIPRLTLSDGCKHHCAFCTVPKGVTEKSREDVMQQVDAFAQHLPADLIYLNDKTFGQAKNHAMLPEIYQRVKAQNPNFRGFVVQTTAAQMKQFTPEFLRNAGIRHAEIGVESFNDPILRAHKKPATEQLIEESAQKCRQAGVGLIPNIMVGLPGENAQTYGKTLGWLNKNKDIISHVNAYNLALYDNTPLGQKIGALSNADRDENQVGKSFHTDPKVHQDFHNKLFDFANKQLDSGPMKKSEITLQDLTGGKAEDGPGISEFDPKQVAKGIITELEHTDKVEVALKIALDHLREDAKYYDKLEVMEGKKESVEKADGIGKLPIAGAKTTREHVVLPVGSTKPCDAQGTRDVGKVKIQGADGKVKWREVRSGMVLGPDGSAISARTAGKK